MPSRRLRQFMLFHLLTVSICFTAAIARGDDSAANSATKPPAQDSAQDSAEWIELTGQWEPIEFGGQGPVEIDDQLITLGMGSPLTGVRWKGKVARENYELVLEARRTEGLDFFCGLTFPVGKEHVSFVLGGWGGGVVGISSIDGYDASENETTMYQQFTMNQWYKVRVRVTAGAIQCWIDDKLAVNQPREGHKFGIRFEMDQSTPLGVAAFQCKSELRKLRFRNLTAAEIQTAQTEIDDSPQPRGN